MASACGATPATPCSATSPISRSSSASSNASEATPLPTPRPYWFEDDPDILGVPFLVMEQVPGACPNPWGREGRKYYAEAADRGVLPASFTEYPGNAPHPRLACRRARVPGRAGGRHELRARGDRQVAGTHRRARPPPGADPHGPDRMARRERPNHRPRLPGPRRLPYRQPLLRQPGGDGFALLEHGADVRLDARLIPADQDIFQHLVGGPRDFRVAQRASLLAQGLPAHLRSGLAAQAHIEELRGALCVREFVVQDVVEATEEGPVKDRRMVGGSDDKAA